MSALHRSAGSGTTCCVPGPQTPAACPCRFARFCSFASFPCNAALSTHVAESTRLRPQQFWARVYFWCFPLQRLSSSPSPVEPRRSCQCPLWLKTTALILRRIRTAILTDFPANTHARTLARAPLGFVARVAPRKEDEVLRFVVCWQRFVAHVVLTTRGSDCTHFFQYNKTEMKWLHQQRSVAKLVAS